MTIREEFDAVWDTRWFGIALLTSGTLLAGAFTVWIQSPGVSVAFMGAVGAAMAARTNAKGFEKAAWMLLIAAFLVTEVLAIRKDRKEHDEAWAQLLGEEVNARTEAKNSFAGIGQGIQTTIRRSDEHFDKTIERSDKIIARVGDTIKTETGGDSFAFITFTAEPAQAFEMQWNNFAAPRGQPYFLVSVTSHGKYPLRGTHAIMMDDERRLAAMKEFNTHPDGDWIKAINSADTEYEMPYLRPQSNEAPSGEVDVLGIYPMPQGDSKRTTINFAAPNGYWNEVLHLGRVNGMWHQCLSVMGPTTKQVTNPFIYCDSDWPEGRTLAEKDWALAKRPSVH